MNEDEEADIEHGGRRGCSGSRPCGRWARRKGTPRRPLYGSSGHAGHRSEKQARIREYPDALVVLSRVTDCQSAKDRLQNKKSEELIGRDVLRKGLAIKAIAATDELERVIVSVGYDS